MSHKYITRVKNTDQYLYKFLFIKDLLNISQINHCVNKLICELTVIKQYSGFKLSEGINLLVDYACANNHIELLNNIYDLSDKFSYTHLATYEASKYGYIKIFEWFQMKKIIIYHENYAYYRMNIYALKNNRTDIIIWLKKNKRKTYNKITDIEDLNVHDKIRMACSYNMVDNLDKINNSDPALLNVYFKNDKYFNNYMSKSIIEEGNVEILEWFHNHNYEQYLKYNLDKNIELATYLNRHSIIKWFVDHKYIDLSDVK